MAAQCVFTVNREQVETAGDLGECQIGRQVVQKPQFCGGQ